MLFIILLSKTKDFDTIAPVPRCPGCYNLTVIMRETLLCKIGLCNMSLIWFYNEKGDKNDGFVASC